MVGQRLTPELTQPNVLVEIDHGPPMRLRQEAQRSTSARELDQMTESWSIMFDASGPTGLQTIEFDGCVARRIANGGTTACIEVESDGTKVEVLEGECAENYGELLTSRRPQASWAHCAKSQPHEDETAFASMHHLKFIEGTKQPEAADHATGITSSQSSGGNPPRIRQRASFATDLSAHAVLPATAATYPSAVRNMRPLNDGPFKVTWTPAQVPTPLLSPLRSREVLFNKSSNGHGNAHNLLLFNEKRVAEGQLASVFGNMPKNTRHCGRPMEDSCTVRLKEPQPTGRTVAVDVEPRLPMSWTSGSKTNFAVDTIEVAREVFMWMNQYTMMTSQCEWQSPLSLCAQATELLLDFVAATISCLHAFSPLTRTRSARVKQCTQEVYCLLDDPG